MSVNERSTLAFVETPTVPTPTTWNPSSFLLLKYEFVKLGSLKKSRSNIFVFLPDITFVKDASETANPTLYPLVKLSCGLINPIVWPAPAPAVNVIVSGIDSVDLNFVSDNLNEFLSILTTKYTSLLTNGGAGSKDLYKILSPVSNRWSFIVNNEVVVLTPEDPKNLGFIIVLLVKSSYSTWYEVVMPGVKDIDTLSFCNKPWFSLHTTVPTTFSIKPVISSFCGLRLCLVPVPCPL